MGQLYINDQLIDFSERTTLGLTFQIADIGSIEKVKGNTSNQFKLPKTKNNLDVLGLPGDLNFSEGLEYRLLRAKYIENGVEVLPYGLATIEVVNEYIELKVISGNAEFFDLLEGDISDLDFNDLNHSWKRTTIINSHQHTEGYIYPIIDYGDLQADSMLVDCRTQRPAVFVRTILWRIFERTGFKYEGDVFYNPDLINEILPFAADTLEQPDGTDESFGAKLNKIDKQYNKAEEWFKITFPDNGTAGNLGGKWDAVNNRYVFLQTITMRFKIIARVSTNTNKPQRFIVKLRKNSETYVGGGMRFFAGSETMTSDDKVTAVEFESDDNLFVAGDYVEVYANSDRTGISFHKSAYVHPNSTFETILGKALYESQVSVQKMIPKLSIKDFIKNWMYRYGLIVHTDNVKKIVSFHYFSDINKNLFKAKDWSDKIEVSNPEGVEFQIGDYAQNNYFKMREDENVPVGLGTGLISIDDQTLALNKDILTSIFAASETKFLLNDNPVAQIRKLDPLNVDNLGNQIVEFTVNTQPRILRIVRKDLPEFVEYHQGNTNDVLTTKDNIPFTYFNFYGLNGLGFDAVFEQYYAEYKHTLQQSKLLEVSVRLNENDVQDFDFFVPIYIGKYGQYFRVNKIQNYVDGQNTIVELIRL